MKHIEADHKTGRQALLAHLCCVGEEVCAVMARLLSAGVRPCFCWANTLEVLCGDYAERVLWVLPPLSSLENWLPLGACLQLWRLLRAGAPFQITGFFCLFCWFLVWFFGVCLIVLYFSCQYCLGHVWSHFNQVFPVMSLSYVWVQSLGRQWYDCMGEKNITACHLGHR